MSDRGIRIPERRCPHCDYKLTGTATMKGPVQAPVPGDYSICIECAGVAVFTEEGFRKLTVVEAMSAAADPEIQRCQKAIWELHRQEGKS